MNLSKFILILMLISFTLISCSPPPPKTVINVFAYQFPKAKDIGWESEYNGLWKVSFHIQKLEYKDAYYDKDGILISTETKVFICDIPATVLSALHKKYSGDLVVNSFERTTPVGKDYEFEIEKEGIITVVGYDKSKRFFEMKNKTFQINNEFTVEND